MSANRRINTMPTQPLLAEVVKAAQESSFRLAKIIQEGISPFGMRVPGNNPGNNPGDNPYFGALSDFYSSIRKLLGSLKKVELDDINNLNFIANQAVYILNSFAAYWGKRR